MDIDMRQLFTKAYALYAGRLERSEQDTLNALTEFMKNRLRAMHADTYATDATEACLASWEGHSLPDLKARIEAVHTLRQDSSFHALAELFKRAHNLTKQLPYDTAVGSDKLIETAEQALLQGLQHAQTETNTCIEKHDYPAALHALSQHLQAPIHQFFESIFVMVEDEALRQQRLHLLQQCVRLVHRIAHLEHLQGSPTS